MFGLIWNVCDCGMTNFALSSFFITVQQRQIPSSPPTLEEPGSRITCENEYAPLGTTEAFCAFKDYASRLAVEVGRDPGRFTFVMTG